MKRVLGRVLFATGMVWSGNAWGQTPPAASFPEEAAPAPGAAPAAPTPAPPPPAAVPPAPPAPTSELDAPTPAPRASAPSYEPPEPEEPIADESRGRRYVSLTFSPLHLFIGPIFELQIEAQLVPHFGVALIGGIGKIDEEVAGVGDVSFATYEFGGQLVGYPLSEFKSLQLGAELLWIHVSTEDVGSTQVRADAGGIAVGPFVGYKLITQVGFTFFAQGGFQYVTAKGDASDNEGNSASAEESSFIPLLNLNVGWSL